MRFRLTFKIKPYGVVSYLLAMMRVTVEASLMPAKCFYCSRHLNDEYGGFFGADTNSDIAFSNLKIFLKLGSSLLQVRSVSWLDKEFNETDCSRCFQGVE